MLYQHRTSEGKGDSSVGDPMQRTQEETTLAARLMILKAFTEMKREQLGLHVFFETAGHDPADRRSVLDAIDELQHRGLIESRGGDFYSLTARGLQAAKAQLPI
jgi:uncharacterized protein YjhX (UPF0386 family)